MSRIRIPGIVGPFVAMERPSVEGDRQLLDQVLLELLGVAFEPQVDEAGVFAKERLLGSVEKLHRVALSLRCAIDASIEQNGEVVS